jgi:hypothetical protein
VVLPLVLAVPPVVMPMLLFAGELINIEDILPWLRWFQHLSVVKYAFHALIIADLEGRHIACPSPAGYCPYPSAEAVVRSIGANPGPGGFRYNVTCLALLAPVFLVAGGLALSRKLKKTTGRS